MVVNTDDGVFFACKIADQWKADVSVCAKDEYVHCFVVLHCDGSLIVQSEFEFILMFI